MRISDWSSDVCSSDLRDAATVVGRQQVGRQEGGPEPTIERLRIPYRHGGEVARILRRHRQRQADGRHCQGTEERAAKGPAGHSPNMIKIWRGHAPTTRLTPG